MAANRRTTFQQLLNADGPLLFSSMPSMLRRDGILDRHLGSFEEVQSVPAPISARRWRFALQKSRILRARRRMVILSALLAVLAIPKPARAATEAKLGAFLERMHP